MTRIVLALAVLALSALACMEQVATPTPVAVVSTASPAPSATLAPILASASPVPTATAGEVATVRAALVNVRQEPGGEVIGQLIAGTDVRVIGCDQDWCEVETDDVSGYIFIGCLSIADGKGCAAK